MKRYEAHITVDKEYWGKVADVGEETGWVYSAITGCPILGPGTYCYLTSYNPGDAGALLVNMNSVIEILRTRGVPVLRSKIEQIIYDTKTGVNLLS